MAAMMFGVCVVILRFEAGSGVTEGGGWWVVVNGKDATLPTSSRSFFYNTSRRGMLLSIRSLGPSKPPPASR